MYEIRNYHFAPERIADYRAWAKDHALPYLNRELDLVGFWVNTDIEPEVLGVQTDELGTANITWIIRWQDTAERERRMAEVFSTDEWQAIFEHVPGGLGSYLRRESKIAESLV